MKAEARLAEAERDAARYRWLRERINWRDVDESGGVFSRDPMKYQARHWMHSDVRLPSSRPASEHIDEYIDAQLTADSAEAVQPESCCLDYPRCDCNSPPEPDGAE